MDPILTNVLIVFVVVLIVIIIFLVKKISSFMNKISALIEDLGESNKEAQKLMSEFSKSSLKVNNVLSDVETMSSRTKQTFAKVNDKIDSTSHMVIAPLSKVLIFGAYFKKGMNLIKKIKGR